MSSSKPECPTGEMKQDVESGKISSNTLPSKTDGVKTSAYSAGSAASKKASPPTKGDGSMSGSDVSTTKKKTSTNFLRHSKEKSVRTGDDVIKSLKWVIFPDNKYIKKWDLLVLTALALFAFILPYQIGVSGSISLLFSIPWLVFNIFLNSIFFVDTFLYFFRAYYTPNGHLVLDLKKIRRHYLLTLFVPNFLSILPYTLSFFVVGTKYVNSGSDSHAIQFLNFILVASLLKLIRLVRARSILASSDVVTNFRQRRNSQVLELWKYVGLIVLVSHWFACIWAFVALLEADGLSEDKLTASPNWIGGWYADNGTEGGLYPLGWEHSIDRYILSLFWAIQTITSIGYGNIIPVTRAEYFTACGLQLCAGVMWAYVIGGLTGVVAGMGVSAEAYRQRSDQANELIHSFVQPDDDTTVLDEDGVTVSGKIVAKHIRKYIHKQNITAMGDSCVCTIPDRYPVFNSLTPELQEVSSVLLLGKYFKLVPYLSPKYLCTRDQAYVAQQCIYLQFASGEIINTECPAKGLGRGVYVFRGGCAFAFDKFVNSTSNNRFSNVGLVLAGMSYGSDTVLLEDGNDYAYGKLQFLTFSQVIFIPREAIMTVLHNNDEKAWKQCARWIYVRTLLLEKIDKEKRDLRTTS